MPEGDQVAAVDVGGMDRAVSRQRLWPLAGPLGADWFARRRPEAQARRLIHQLIALGYTVTAKPSEAA